MYFTMNFALSIATTYNYGASRLSSYLVHQVKMKLLLPLKPLLQAKKNNCGHWTMLVIPSLFFNT